MPVIDFLLVGAMKSGTTTLIHYLRKHPDIFIPKVKEPQFFSRDEKYSKGISWYEDFFVDANPEQICGEGSTCYSRWPDYPNSAKRIYEYAPRVKFIYIVREPVERTYSHFRHCYLKGEFDHGSFREALETQRALIESSKYMQQIAQYLNYFESSQFYFLKFEDLVNPSRETFTELFKFLSVSNANVLDQAPLASNKAGVVRTKRKIVRYIQLAKYIPWFSYLVKTRFPPPKRNMILHALADMVTNSRIGKYLVNRRVSRVPAMLPEDQYLIYKKCEIDLKEFEKFSKLDLSDWYRIN